VIIIHPADYSRIIKPKFQYFLDDKGVLYDKGDVINEGDIIEYWNTHYAKDPQASGYDSFNEWWVDIKAFLVPLTNED